MVFWIFVILYTTVCTGVNTSLGGEKGIVWLRHSKERRASGSAINKSHWYDDKKWGLDAARNRIGGSGDISLVRILPRSLI